MEDWWLTLWVGYFGIGLYPKIYGRIKHILFVVESQGIHANYDGKFFFKILEMFGNSKIPLNYHELLFFVVLAAIEVEF